MLDVLTRPQLIVGRLAGVPVALNVSWFPVVLLVIWSLATGFLPQAAPSVGDGARWVAAIAGTLLFFASILAHEFGHSLVAIRYGIPVSSVTLFVLGGVSRIGEEPRTAREELWIAAAGPAVSLLAAGLFSVAGWVGVQSAVVSAVAVYLMLVNVALALFNVLPALPLDGGRMLRAALWGLTGDSFLATRWAARSGRACGVAFVILGLVSLGMGALLPAAWLLLLGVFIERSASSSVESLQLDVHVPPSAQALPGMPEGTMDHTRFRRVEGKILVWRSRLDLLPRPGEAAAESGVRDDDPLARRYADDRMRMFELLDEIDTGVRGEMSDDDIDARFGRLAALHSAWNPPSFSDGKTPPGAEESLLAGRPEGYAPDPEEALSREPGSSIEV